MKDPRGEEWSRARRSAGQADRGLATLSGPQQVLSLRVDEDVVPLLDAAWEKHGMRSRMELVRRALHRELEALGESEAAAPFAPDGQVRG